MQTTQCFLQAAAIAAAVFVTVCGCSTGSNAPPVCGTVSFNGQPVPRGTVIFTSSGTGNNTGSSGEITDGKYCTTGGIVPGVYEVTVEGYDNKSAPPGVYAPRGIVLFPPHHTQVTVSADSSVVDLQVPSSSEVKATNE